MIVALSLKLNLNDFLTPVSVTLVQCFILGLNGVASYLILIYVLDL